MLKKIFILTLTITMAVVASDASLQSALAANDTADQIDNVQIFGSEPLANPTNEGRGLGDCASANVGQFLGAMIGYQGFLDYWRDLLIGFVYPMYFADISNVENQVNKARMQVVAAYFRCDMDRATAAISALNKLEAELHFVRHYVNLNGLIDINDEFSNKDPAAREQFVREMSGNSYFATELGKVQAGGYFDLFKSQYAERSKGYVGSGDDPIYAGLAKKFDSLVNTMKGLKDAVQGLGKEVAKSAEDLTDAAKDAGSATVSAFEKPGSALKNLVMGAANRFQVCGDVSSTGACKPIGDLMYDFYHNDLPDVSKELNDVAGKLGSFIYAVAMLPAGVVVGGAELVADGAEAIANAVSDTGSGLTNNDRNNIKAQLELLDQEIKDRADMLTRYEVLYGEISGSEVRAISGGMDQLILTLGENKDAGSIQQINDVAKCAEDVKDRVCGGIYSTAKY